MQKKLIAAAVAGALGIPAVAMAQTSTVNIYGRFYVEYEFVKQGQNRGVGLAPPTTDRVNGDFLQAPGSSIGFRGEEKLGGGMSAWFQCENSTDFRGANGDGWCTRNSALGMKGAFGNAFIGVWDMPFKRARIMTGANDTGMWGVAGLLTGHSTTVGDGAAGPQLFARRQINSLHYASPNFGGFSVNGAVTSVNQSTGRTSTASNDKPRIWSVAGMYGNGPLNVNLAYERHVDIQPVGAGSVLAPGFVGDESGWLLAGSYRFANSLTLGGMYTRQRWDTVGGGLPAGATGESRVNAWHIGIDWKISGPHGMRASYTRAGDIRGLGAAAVGGLRPAANPLGDTDATMYQARYVHALSKRTEFVVGFNHVRNGQFAGYNINGIGATGGQGGGNGLGGKHTGYGVAFDHRF